MANVQTAAPVPISAEPRLRVAVITPYFRADPDKLQRCCASVAAQTHPCDHILVADGEPQALPDMPGLVHFVLPANVGNCGASPRGFGAQYAFVQGYDAVAFLDADNWYDEDHVALAVEALRAGSGKTDVVFGRRHVIFPDGQVLRANDPEEEQGKHVDTNCYVIAKRAAFLAAAWAQYPAEFGVGEDRLMYQLVKNHRLRTVWLDKKTVWYETNWRIHYSMARRPYPDTMRAPEKSIHKTWDPELFYQRTGWRLGRSGAQTVT